jgi:hypothetical protein
MLRHRDILYLDCSPQEKDTLELMQVIWSRLRFYETWLGYNVRKDQRAATGRPLMINLSYKITA